MNADNRSVVDNYQTELTREIRTLCNTVAASISQQNEHLQCIEKFCNSFSDVNVKVLTFGSSDYLIEAYCDVDQIFMCYCCFVFTKYYFTALFK